MIGDLFCFVFGLVIGWFAYKFRGKILNVAKAVEKEFDSK